MQDDQIKSPDTSASADEEAKEEKRASWKVDLDLNFIKRRKREHPPTGYDKKTGVLKFSEDPDNSCKGYILWDSNRDAPPGFGLKVGKKKTYILRRKVHGKSIMPTVGNVADFATLDLARKKAGEMALTILETGRNPNEIARIASAAELTLGQALADYRNHIANRGGKPAKPETLRVHDRVARKHVKFGWTGKKLVDFTAEEIENKFFIDKDRVPSANEQAFRWASAAVNWCIEMEKFNSTVAKRPPAITLNPFSIIGINGHYREETELEELREEQSKRNPLRPSRDLGPFLEAAWSKKDMNDNMTGIHYLLFMLLWGCRESEHAKCVWGELLEEHGPAGIGRKTTSHVWMKDDEDYGPHVFFYRTKNGRSHRLPITPMALELLRRRQVAAAEETIRRGFGAKSRPFVFPARSKFSKTGHYSDSTDLLDDLREEIGVAKLNRHDLRRSFGSMMTTLQVPQTIQRRFFNHAHVEVTDRYNQAEWAQLRIWMERIEQGILMAGPNLYNSLKPSSWPPIPAPERHVCRPPKPRTGRPRKAAQAAADAAKQAEAASAAAA